MSLNFRATGGRVLRPNGWSDEAITVADGLIADDGSARDVDLTGYLVLPGIVDVHGDGFERHLAPRRGALREASEGMVSVAAELAANGITTGVLAQFFSWEGGLRGPEFAEHVFGTVAKVRSAVTTDLQLQLRLETHMLDQLHDAESMVEKFGIRYVVFNDHLAHQRLADGRKPPRLVGQALKSGRNPDAYLAMMQGLHSRTTEVPAEITKLAARLAAKGVYMGSHDDRTADARKWWRGIGALISEFPETVEAAKAARDNGDAVVLGAPNVVRGASHAGNVSATDLIEAGLCDALASDYHYPAIRAAAWRLANLDLIPFEQAWALVSSGPASLLGFSDRGTLESEKRADIVILDQQTRRVAATICGGRISYMTGAIADRFFL